MRCTSCISLLLVRGWGGLGDRASLATLLPDCMHVKESIHNAMQWHNNWL